MSTRSPAVQRRCLTAQAVTIDDTELFHSAIASAPRARRDRWRRHFGSRRRPL